MRSTLITEENIIAHNILERQRASIENAQRSGLRGRTHGFLGEHDSHRERRAAHWGVRVDAPPANHRDLQVERRWEDNAVSCNVQVHS